MVVGSTLEAALYARLTNSVLILNEEPVIHEYEVFDDLDVLRRINYRVVASGQKIVNKKRLLDRLLFDMSLKGHLPITRSVESININGGENKLGVIVNSSRIGIHYKNLRLFDHTKVHGLPFNLKRELLNVRTYDWFKANIINDVQYQQFDDSESKIARKITVRKVPKNIVIVESHIQKEDIEDFNYSDTMVRLKTIRTLKDAGLTGQRNGYYESDPTRPRYRPIKLDFMRREMIKEYKPMMVRHKNIMFNDTGY